jgi:hypothetical protein
MLSEETNEILIKNWYRYNWAGGSPKVLTAVKNVVKWIKNEDFKAYILEKVGEFEKRKETKENTNKLTNTYTETYTYTETETDTDTDVSIGYGYPIDTLSDSLPESVDKKTKRTKFIKPSIEEIAAYCRERNNMINPERFFDHYESNGWKVGRTGMKDWKAAVRQWERSDFESGKRGSDPFDVRNQYWDENDPTVH